MVLYDYGVDLNSNFRFKDGDLELISYEQNIGQAIRNRLNTTISELNTFYEDYGSVLPSFFGWKRKEKTLTFMKIELDNVLAKDPRITNFATVLSYNEKGEVEININLTDDVDLELNLIIGSDNTIRNG
ncbi:hypothetical protein [Methanobrevibacter sp.]